MKYIIVAAIGKNYELGIDNHLIWYLPNDLKFFKEVTNNKTILMGSNTFRSLPKMLPNRKHIVISSKNGFPSGVEVYNSVEDVIDKNHDIDGEIYVIGGQSIYTQFINYVDEMYLTHIDAECKEADSYFPAFNNNDWDSTVLKKNVDNNISYQHVLYRKKEKN